DNEDEIGRRGGEHLPALQFLDDRPPFQAAAAGRSPRSCAACRDTTCHPTQGVQEKHRPTSSMDGKFPRPAPWGTGRGLLRVCAFHLRPEASLRRTTEGREVCRAVASTAWLLSRCRSSVCSIRAVFFLSILSAL